MVELTIPKAPLIAKPQKPVVITSNGDSLVMIISSYPKPVATCASVPSGQNTQIMSGILWFLHSMVSYITTPSRINLPRKLGSVPTRVVPEPGYSFRSELPCTDQNLKNCSTLNRLNQACFSCRVAI